AITCPTPGPDYLEVSDGFVADFDGDGIDSGGARVLDCFDLHIDRCARGIVVRTSGIVEACHIERCTADGLAWLKSATEPNVFIADECEFRACGRHGLAMLGDWSQGDSTVSITDCDAIGNTQDGIHLTAVVSSQGSGKLCMSVNDCRCASNGGFGKRMSTISSPGLAALQCAVQMEDCVCTGNGLGGIR